MDENILKLANVIASFIVIQTIIFICFMRSMWSHFNRKFEQIDKRFDKLDEKVMDIDRQLCRLEGAFASKDCCMIKYDRQIKRVE